MKLENLFQAMSCSRLAADAGERSLAGAKSNSNRYQNTKGFPFMHSDSVKGNCLRFPLLSPSGLNGDNHKV